MKNFDDWVPYSGGAEGSGRGIKDWLEKRIDEDLKIGIFKYPKIHNNGELTGEHWAEDLATKIANVIGIDCAQAEVGKYYDTVGVMSYLVRNYYTENLVEGINYITNKYPTYDPEKLKEYEENKIYSIQMIKESIKDTGLFFQFLKIPIFDCLIGNSDRHQSNWGLITDKSNKPLRIAPVYDNGSSLCCRIKKEDTKRFLKEMQAFKALTDTQSKSLIGWNDYKRPRHFDMVKFIKDTYYNETINFVKNIALRFTNDVISNIVHAYSDELINKDLKKILISFLKEKRNRILSIYELEGGNNMNKLLVVWKDINSRSRFIIGELVKDDDEYSFKYNYEIDEARKNGFNGIIGLSDFKKTYNSEKLFPVFSSRLPDRKRKDIDIILEKYSLEKYDAFELLKACGGRTPIDTIEFVEPIDLKTLDYTEEILRDFFIAGIRYCEICDGKVENITEDKCTIKEPLSIGERLYLKLEPENKYDKYAVALYNKRNVKVGYIPKFFSEAIAEAVSSKHYVDCKVDFFNSTSCCQECTKVSLIIKKV